MIVAVLKQNCLLLTTAPAMMFIVDKIVWSPEKFVLLVRETQVVRD